MLYAILKHIHMTTVVITFILFNLRFIWMLQDSPRLQQYWINRVPHINDTILLLAAIGMMYSLDQWPISTPWLTVKVFGLLAYIVLGAIALRRAPTKATRAIGWVAATATFFYVIAVAYTKNPFPFS